MIGVYKMADKPKPQEEFGGKGGSGDVTGKENLFVRNAMLSTLFRGISPVNP
jgi:hypothetical protein